MVDKLAVPEVDRGDHQSHQGSRPAEPGSSSESPHIPSILDLQSKVNKDNMLLMMFQLALSFSAPECYCLCTGDVVR